MGRTCPNSAQTSNRRAGDQFAKSSLSFVGVRNLGNIEAPGLFGRLHGARVQSLGVDPRHRRVLGEDRPETAAAEFGGFFGQKIDTVALDGREDQPEVGGASLRACLAFDSNPCRGLRQALDRALPFAFPPVEKQNGCPCLAPQDVAKIMNTRRIQIDDDAGAERRFDVKAWNHSLLQPRANSYAQCLARG